MQKHRYAISATSIADSAIAESSHLYVSPICARMMDYGRQLPVCSGVPTQRHVSEINTSAFTQDGDMSRKQSPISDSFDEQDVGSCEDVLSQLMDTTVPLDATGRLRSHFRCCIGYSELIPELTTSDELVLPSHTAFGRIDCKKRNKSPRICVSPSSSICSEDLVYRTLRVDIRAKILDGGEGNWEDDEEGHTSDSAQQNQLEDFYLRVRN